MTEQKTRISMASVNRGIYEGLNSLSDENKFKMMTYIHNPIEAFEIAKELALATVHNLPWMTSAITDELILRMAMDFHRVEKLSEVLVSMAQGKQDEEKQKALRERVAGLYK